MRATLLLLLLTGCSSFSDKLLTELTIDERVEVCVGLEMPRKTVMCGEREVQAGLEDTACERATLERAPVNPACAATVGEYRTCMVDIYDDPCVGHPSCDALQGCFAAAGD